MQFLRRNVKLCRKGDGYDITEYSPQHTQFNAERFKSNSPKRCDRGSRTAKNIKKGTAFQMPVRILTVIPPGVIESTRGSRTPRPVYITHLHVQSYADFEEDFKSELGVEVKLNAH